MHSSCLKCAAKCCYYLVEVLFCDDVPEEMTTDDGYMIQDDTGKCVALENGLCSIYERRPTVCKQFFCDEL